MRKIRKSSDIMDMNKLDILYFNMGGINDDPVSNTLHITGENGYPYIFVHLRFIETVYVSCLTSFEENVRWRLATEQEAALMHEYADEDRATVYCIEEKTDGYLTPLHRKARTFFIVAWGLDITVSYEEGVADMVRDWGHEV